MNKLLAIFEKNYILILFFIIILIAAFFRLWRINSIPFGLNNDSAWEASAALDILDGNYSDYIPYAAEGWRGEGIIRVIIAGIFLIIGNNPLAIPLSTAFFGIGLIIGNYYLIKKLFDEKLALISSFFIAISGWHIVFSKTGWRAVTVPFFTTLLFYFFFKGLETKKNINFILSGIFLGVVSLYTYDGARAVPIFFLIWLFIESFTKKKFIKEYFKNILVLFISAFVISLPMIFYAFNNFENFKSRSDYLFVGHKIQQENSIIPLFESITKTALTFNVNANGNDFFISEPLVDFPLSILVPIGLLISLYFIVLKREKKYLFILIWLATASLPGILSEPNGNRLIGTIPSIYFLCAVGLFFPVTYFISKLKTDKNNKKIISTSVIITFFVYSMLITYNNYLGENRRDLAGFYPETKVTTDYIKTIWLNYDIYLTDNYPRELLTYYLYKPGTNSFNKNYTWLEYNHEFLEVEKNKNKGIGFFMFNNPENEYIANQLLKKYPGSNRFYIWYQNDNIYRAAALVVLVKP